jgi:WD40 repeat protein
MPNPTHPPTQFGDTSSTRLVPEEFGGRGGGDSATVETTKPGSRVSRRKLLLGVGGLAGVAVAGGGAYAALGAKSSSSKNPVTPPAGTANAAAVSSSSASGTPSSSSSDSTSASDTASGGPSAGASSTAAQAPSAAGGTQPALAPGATPLGSVDIAGQPFMNIGWIGNGAALVVADDANGVQVFDVSKPASVSRIANIAVPLSGGRLQPLDVLDYSPQRNLLVLGGAGGLSLVDVRDPKNPVQQSSMPDVNGKKVSGLAFNHDGTKVVVTTTEDSGSCVLDVTDPKTTPSQWSALTPSDNQTLNGAYFSHTDKYIVTTGSGGMFSSSETYQLWDSSDLHNVRTTNSTPWWTNTDGSTMKIGAALYVAESGPWHTLVVGVVSADSKSQDLQFLDFAQAQNPTKLWYLSGTSGAVAFHPTRLVVAVGDARNGATTVWDLTDPKQPAQVARLVADAGFVASVAFNPDGSQLAVAVKRDGSTNDSNAVVYFWKM